jgi:hypothetical protein
VGVSGGVRPSAPAAGPPQMGVLGSVQPSAPVATPSAGNTLLAVLLHSASTRFCVLALTAGRLLLL